MTHQSTIQLSTNTNGDMHNITEEIDPLGFSILRTYDANDNEQENCTAF